MAGAGVELDDGTPHPAVMEIAMRPQATGRDLQPCRLSAICISFLSVNEQPFGVSGGLFRRVHGRGNLPVLFHERANEGAGVVIRELVCAVSSP